jgi:hypothetical protein
MRDQEDPAGVKLGRGGFTSLFPETNCKRRWGRHLPGQKPGLRNAVGIRKRKCRGRGSRVTPNTASCKEELDPMDLTATVTSASITGGLMWAKEKVLLSFGVSLLSASLLQLGAG